MARRGLAPGRRWPRCAVDSRALAVAAAVGCGVPFCVRLPGRVWGLGPGPLRRQLGGPWDGRKRLWVLLRTRSPSLWRRARARFRLSPVAVDLGAGAGCVGGLRPQTPSQRPPITHKIDAGVLPSRRTLAAARVGRGVQCSRVHLTPIAQQASEDGTRKDGESLQGARVDWAAGGPSLTASI